MIKSFSTLLHGGRRLFPFSLLSNEELATVIALSAGFTNVGIVWITKRLTYRILGTFNCVLIGLGIGFELAALAATEPQRSEFSNYFLVLVGSGFFFTVCLFFMYLSARSPRSSR